MGRWLLLGLAACYSPRPDAACSITCNANNERACPSGLACVANVCQPSGGCTTSDGDVPGDDADTIPTVCFGQGLLRECFPPGLPPFEVVNPTTIDTDNVPCAFRDDMRGLCFVAAGRITIANRLTGVGTLALVLWAEDAIVVETLGVIDVASHPGVQNGAGANNKDCAARDEVGFSGASQQAPGGGAGGSFVFRGGNGGAGIGANGGTAKAPVPAVTTVRGGCPGAFGGRGANGTQTSGDSGGAVYLIAGNSITIRGVVDASGGGSPAGQPHFGGGGGGSGGLIGLDAIAIKLEATARVGALGGGGGSGSDNQMGAAGNDPRVDLGLGAAPSTGPEVTPGIGGGSTATDGAAGSASGGSRAGGGGGGGSAGAIRVFGAFDAAVGAIVEPPRS